MMIYPTTPKPNFIEVERRRMDIVADEQRRHVRRLHKTILRDLQLRYVLLSESQFEVLLNFFNTHRGPTKRFNFIHPKTGEQYKARFLDSALEWAHTAHSNRYELTVRIGEAP